MKNIIFCILTLILSISALKAQDYKSALGLRATALSPTAVVGISLNHFFNEDRAFEAILTTGIATNTYNLGLIGTYKIYNEISKTDLSWYYGGGAYTNYWTYQEAYSNERSNPWHLGVLGQVGMEWHIQNAPFTLSIDWTPHLHLLGNGDFYGGVKTGGVALRYIFD